MGKRDPERERRWRALMAEWEASGKSARAFCQARELNQHTFYGWRRELRRRDGQSKSLGKNSSESEHRQQFVQVEVRAEPWLELSLGDQLVLRVPSSVDADRLAEIFVAARKATAC